MKTPARPWGNTYSLRQALRSGTCLTGMFVGIPHPMSIETISAFGWDLVVVDAEHAAMSLETIRSMVVAAEVSDLPAIVRVPASDAGTIATALDTGAHGILIPRVETAAEVAQAVQFARFPPRGKRGLGPSRATRYGLEMPQYLQRADKEVLVGIQIESAQSIANLDEILSVDDVDFALIGTGDLAVSLDLSPSDSRFVEVLDTTIDRLLASTVSAGIFAPSPEDAARWTRRGVQVVLLGSDIRMLIAGTRDAAEQFRQHMAQ